jgi:hypothetical protein
LGAKTGVSQRTFTPEQDRQQKPPKNGLFWGFLAILTAFDVHMNSRGKAPISLYYRDLVDFIVFSLFAILHVKLQPWHFAPRSFFIFSAST